MQLKQLLADDDAVSPVIGVILMVAITVILAAVIATFVLGLGDSVSETAPQASFSTEYSEINTGVDGTLEITHDSGETITATDLYVRGQNGSNAASSTDFDDSWKSIAGGGLTNSDGSATATKGGESAVTGGNYIEFGIGTDGNIKLVYDSSDSDSSATLTNWEGPDA